MKFKVGDKVFCHDDAGSANKLIRGYRYEVVGVEPSIGRVRIKGLGGDWFFRRFEVEPPQSTLGVCSDAGQRGTMKTTLPTDSNERKNFPLFRGVMRYFPAALAGVAKISKVGNDKHNPGEELHHARGKSNDHGDCVVRHLMDTADLLAAHERGEGPTPEAVLNEVNQLAWRALALSQELHEKFGAPLAPGAKK